MIRPISFRKNEETAENNYFQQDENEISADEIQGKALAEFDLFVEKLREKGIEVFVFDDRESDLTPDSIFPNNWISFHNDGTILTYPMYAENRRLERRDDVINKLQETFLVNNVHSFAHWENKGKFLEGTGSMILDRPSKIAYASLSERTNEDVLNDFCEKAGYESMTFTSFQTVNGRRLPIYHTNVMMALGENYAIVCLDSIDNAEEREHMVSSIQKSGKEIIEITEEQMHQFAGNMLQVMNDRNEPFTVMSRAAYESLDETQIDSIEKYGEIIHSPIPTIEKLGGGSVRCMMAEVFLPKQLFSE
ncbi:citrulline utilization hydrolase CtlX [Ekhidna sp. To15]|uniref:citrulline utilization hydrolase CtlX n=1 Tax=Ekhidna sp. To15 TaxID=3395267 RepID=UPI003F51FF73